MLINKICVPHAYRRPVHFCALVVSGLLADSGERLLYMKYSDLVGVGWTDNSVLFCIGALKILNRLHILSVHILFLFKKLDKRVIWHLLSRIYHLLPLLLNIVLSISFILPLKSCLNNRLSCLRHLRELQYAILAKLLYRNKFIIIISLLKLAVRVLQHMMYKLRPEEFLGRLNPPDRHYLRRWCWEHPRRHVSLLPLVLLMLHHVLDFILFLLYSRVEPRHGRIHSSYGSLGVSLFG